MRLISQVSRNYFRRGAGAAASGSSVELWRDREAIARLAGRRWLPDMDLNHDKQIQSLLCYRYTIGQTSASKVGFSGAESRIEQDHAC